MMSQSNENLRLKILKTDFVKLRVSVKELVQVGWIFYSIFAIHNKVSSNHAANVGNMIFWHN